jgi:hypothetical protein
MISVLLALSLSQVPDAAPASQDAQATLQSCEMTPAGWVCNYRMPPVILRGAPPETVIMTDQPAIAVAVPPTVSPSVPPPDVSSVEADRQARLIARCADASWLSLCLPGDRREARILQQAAVARAALRGEVTRLLSENRCEEAVRAALVGGDLALATEARGWTCSPTAGSTGPAVPETAGIAPSASS